MKYKLSELFELQMGKTPSRDNPEYWSQPEFPWISIADLTNAGKYIYDTKESLSKLAVEESGIKIIPAQTVIMSFKLSIGKVSITPVPMYSNEAIMAFIDKGIVEIKPEYLYYLLLHRDWDAGTNKAVMGKTLNKATLSEVSIDVHPIEEQERIIAILDKANEIIEGYRRQLLALDTLIKARFVEMFGECDYPHKELIELIVEGAGLSYGIVQPGDDGTGDMGVLRPVDLSDGRITTASIKYIDRSIGDGFKKTELTGEELLITVRGTTGITALTDARFAGMNVTRGIAVIRYDQDKINPVYLNAYLNTEESQRYIQEHTRGATLQQINLSDLRVQQILVPPRALQDEYSSFVQQVDKSRVVVQRALERAQVLFDSLMQEYFG